MQLRRFAAVLLLLVSSTTAALGEDITSATLQIQGVGLRVETVSVTTAIDVPTTIQTEFGGKKNDEAPAVPGLIAVGELTGPGIDTPIQLTTAPGHRFQIPGLSREGTYLLQNVRLMNGNEFVQQATPSAASIVVANILQTKVRVRQLTPEEIRSRGIIVDGRNFEVYEYSLSFLIGNEEVVIPFPVVIDPRTHEVTPIAKETPYSIPQTKQIQPPRWSPPQVIPFEFPPKPEEPGGEPAPPQPEKGERIRRPKIAAAIVIPNSMAVLHQFFAVALTVTNGAPGGSTATLQNLQATIKVPAALRSVKSIPAVAFGQAVPIVDPTTGVTFLIAQGRAEAEWTLEGLRPGTHTVEIDVRGTLREVGQEDVPLRATPRATIVVHDPRFNLTFSHPDVVRKGIDYTTYSFVTNITPTPQTIRVANGVPSCDQAPGANVCRIGGAEFDELTLASGEMKLVEYKLRAGVTGKVFATAGTVEGNTISAAVQLHMGVSESGIPLSPSTLVLPYYAQFVDQELVGENLALLGLGYSLATAPVNQVTAKFPRVIKTDVFYRAGDIARAGQRIFISNGNADVTRHAIANLTLDLLGNGVELREWDELRRKEKNGRRAGASLFKALNPSASDFLDTFATAVSHRNDFIVAVARGASVALRGTSGRRAAVANEAESGWLRDLPFADVSRFATGEIGVVARITEETEVIVTPSASGPFTVELLFHGTNGPMRARFELTGTAGQPLRIVVPRAATSLNALMPNGGIAGSATASAVPPAPLQAVAARQDLNLDPEGHKVAVLFNRPVALQTGADLLTKFAGTIAFNRDGVVFNGPRTIFAAALQEDQRIAVLSFEHVLSTNAEYSLAVSPLVDPIANAEASFPTPLRPKIDNNRPAGIVFGKFIKGDNSPFAGSEVRLYTGHWRGCQVGILDGDPPPDCNPYKEAPQYVKSGADGSFLFEYIPRDPIGDAELNGGYVLMGVTPDGRYGKVDGTVRLPGRVHFVNIQMLGRGGAEGVVRYENGQKVANAEVFAGSTLFNIGRRGKTDANGFYQVGDLPVGPITVTATDTDGNVAYASTEIAVPGQVAKKDLLIIRKAFPGTGTLFGVVRRSDNGQPVGGARVGVKSQGYAIDEVFTGSDGKFEFRKVPAGFVTLLAAEFSIAREAVAADFDLKPDEVRQQNLTLSIIDASAVATTLTGTVVRENPLAPGDSSRYERVSGAVVNIGKIAVTADAQGNFTVDPVYVHWTANGSLPIEAYDPSTKRIGKTVVPTLTRDGPNQVTIFIPANSYGSGTIRVRVLDARGTATSAFRVLEPGFPPTVLRSIGGGLYEYPNAPVGANIDVWAVQGGTAFGDQYTHGFARLDFPGQITTTTLRLPGQGTVRVKLRGDFDVIGDVNIGYRAWDEAEQEPLVKTITRSTSNNGVADFATFEKVPALQQYTVTSDHPSFGHAEASGTLAYEGDLANHILTLNKLSTIRGVVYAVDGITPIAGAAVRLSDGRRDPGVQFSQPDGTFVFHDVPSSVPFSVTAETVQSGIYRTGVAGGTTPALGGNVTTTIVMRRRGNVEGRVVYAGYKTFDPNNPANNVTDNTPNDLSDNAPVPLAKLWLRELDFPGRFFGTNVEPMSADISGRFAISNVFVGPLRAAAWDAGNQELRGDWTGALSEEGQVLTNVFIAIGGDGTGAVRVTVVDPNQLSAPIANAEVGLHRSGLFDFTTTDGAGVATFQQVPAGSYAVTAYSKALGKSGATAVNFTVTRDTTADVRILLVFAGKVDGTLTDPEGTPANRPVPAAQVMLRGLNFTAASSTDLAGAFSFQGVREGGFDLETKDPASNRRARASGLVSAANPHPIVNLQLEPLETLHFAVYLPDDTGAKSNVLAPPVGIEVFQRCANGAGTCDFRRAAEGNPVVMPGLLRNESYGVLIRELGGLGRTFDTGGQFPKGTAANPLTFVLPAYGDVEVIVTQAGVPATGARVELAGKTLFADATGKVIARAIRLGNVSAQATSVDGSFSGSAAGVLARQSVALVLSIELGSNAGITGIVEAEAGGPSIGTRVVAGYVRTVELMTDSDGRYTFKGIPTPSTVTLTYIGPDGVTVGARQVVSITNAHARAVVPIPAVKLDATPPQVVSITPADGATNVSPDSSIRVVFSERIPTSQLNVGNVQLVAADGSGQVTTTYLSSVAADGKFVVTMVPPAPQPGQRYPLRSNTLYRVIVSGNITDLTGHHLPSPLGTTFTTSDYVEPRVIRVVPSPTLPVPEQITFEFHFNEPVDPAPWQPGGSASLRFFKITAAGAAGQIVSEKSGRAFIDPATALILYFAPDQPIEPESFYRVIFTGIRDLQGNPLAEQTFHFFSFDRTKPVIRLVSPVPEGFNLVSGVEYTLNIDTASTDIASVDYFRAETYLTTVKTAPFAYRFVAPEAPEAGVTLTLRATATDGSGNVSDPASITWTVKPNAAPKNIAVVLTPQTAYPGNDVVAETTFEDEGTFATVQVVLRGTRTDGAEYTDSKTKQLTRASVSAAWPSSALTFTLPPSLRTDAPPTFTGTVTDVRGLAAAVSATLTLRNDSSPPSIVSLTPAPETRFALNQQFRAEAVVSDGETGVASVVFVIDGQSYPVTTSVAGPSAGTRKFTSPLITVPAKNVDTRIPVTATATDFNANSAMRAVEVIYIGVNDPTVPRAAWQCPVDRAAIPASQTAFALPLRIRATDDISVTSVRFRIPGMTEPVAASRVGTTDDYTATATIATPAAGEPFVITAEVSDADPSHMIRLAVAIDLVAVDVIVDTTQAVTTDSLSLYMNKTVLVRSATGRLVTHVPVTLANLLVLDGGRVDSLPTTTTIEHRVDITVADHLYVDCTSTVDVSAKGYLGGWGVNADGSNTKNESATGRVAGNVTTGGASNAGASHGGLGQAATSNVPYGSITAPVALGAGGSGMDSCCSAGGSGGGAIALRTTPTGLGRFAISGSIRANGEFRMSGGAGGSILIAAKQIVLGAGALVTANGGHGPPAGGGGRIAITAIERLDIASPLDQLQSRGGVQRSGSAMLQAAPGTVFIKRPSEQFGELFVAAFASLPTRATPISGASLRFDRVELGPFALARFDDEVTIGAPATVAPTAALLLPSDVPIASITTVPAPSSNLIRATELEISLDASSRGGIAEARFELAPLAPRVESVTGYPASVTARKSKIAIPHDAALGAATLAVRIVDRADRVAVLAPRAFTIIDNQPPAITSFTAAPDSLYPGKSVTATISATDDVSVTKLSVAATIGAAAPIVQTANPNLTSATQTFTVNVPITTPGGTAMSIEGATEDSFPGRAAVKQTKTITILTDTVAPTVTITAPTADQLFNEASGATFTIRATAVDAEVGVKTMLAKVGAGVPVAMTAEGGGAWRATVPVPNVDGVNPVPIVITVTGADYEGNSTTASVRILVRPLNDPNGPAIRWTCSSPGAMYPPGYVTKLRVFAKGATTSNGVQKVEVFIGLDPALTASSIGSDQYEVSWTVPDAADGTTVDIRAVATSVGGNQSDVATSVTIVTGTVITADTTVGDSSLDNKTVIVRSGTLTLSGQRSFTRLVVLDGAKVTHAATDAAQIGRLTTNATRVYVSCTGSIDVTAKGFGGNEAGVGRTWPNTFAGGSAPGSGGSHGGTGGGTAPAQPYGSLFDPDTPGGAGAISSGNCAVCSPGGGIARVVTSTFVLDGSVLANGISKRDFAAGGAGGSIRIDAQTLSGAGEIRADSGTWDASGGGGRIAIYYGTLSLDRARITAAAGGGNGTSRGSAGTIYLRRVVADGSYTDELSVENGGVASSAKTRIATAGAGTVTAVNGSTLTLSQPVPEWVAGSWLELLDANGAVVASHEITARTPTTVTLRGVVTAAVAQPYRATWRFNTVTAKNAGEPDIDSVTAPLLSGSIQAGEVRGDSVTINGGPVAVAKRVVVRELLLQGSAVLTHPATWGTDNPVCPNPLDRQDCLSSIPRLNVIARDAITIDATSRIDVTGKGFAGNQNGAGRTWPNTFTGGSTPGSGGSHGGAGGGAGTAAATYGSLFDPNTPGGSGAINGGNCAVCSPGGGVARISTRALTVNGSVLANGISKRDFASGGAGGSIRIDAESITGTGDVRADGGMWDASGGGGRIALYFTTLGIDRTKITALAGGGNGANRGAPGTIYLKSASTPFGELVVADTVANAAATRLTSVGVRQVAAVTADSVRVGGTLGHVAGIRLFPATDRMKHWPIVSNTADTMRVDTSASALSLAAGDQVRGLQRFEKLTLRNARLEIEDILELVQPIDKDGISVVRGNNAAAPILDGARVRLASSSFGASVAGSAGAVSDTDTPVTLFATNLRSGTTFSGPAATDGSFAVGVQGQAGDRISIRARDANFFPLESPPFDAGMLTESTPVASQLDKTAWTAEPVFKPQTIAVDGRVLAVASSVRNGAQSDKLVVLDVADPARPAFTRTIATGLGPIRDFDVARGWAFIAGDRFATIDLTKPAAAMNYAADQCGVEESVVVSGSYAFTGEIGCAENGRILVYDISNPATPRYLRNHDVAGFGGHVFHDLVAYGGYLVGISSSATGRDLMVIDRRDVNALKKVAELQIPNFVATRGRVSGSRIYVTGTTSPEMVVVDLTNPAAPVIAGRLALPAAAGHVRPLETSAFVAAGTQGLVETTLDPSALLVTGTAATGGNAQDVAVGAGYAYVANEIGVAVVPISVPPQIDRSRITLSLSGTMVTVTGAFRAITGAAPLSAEVKNGATAANIVLTVAADGSFTAALPASAGDAITIKVTDALSRVTGPVVIGSVPFASGSRLLPIVIANDPNFRSRIVRVEGTIAAIASYPAYGLSSDRLVVYDISNPAAPVQTRIVATGIGSIRDVQVVGGTAYIAGDRFGTIDLRNPTSTVRYGADQCGVEESIAVSGGYAFTGEQACAENGRILVWDVSDPLAPLYRGNRDVAGFGGHIFHDLLPYGSDYLIALSSSATGRDVMVIDRRDVNALKKIAELQIPSFVASRGRIAGSTLFIAGADDGVATVDLSVITAPRLLSVVNTPGLAFNVEVSGATVMAADRGAGVSFLDNSAVLRLAGNEPVGGDAWDVALGGANLYVAAEQGLAVIENVVAPPHIQTPLITIGSSGAITGQRSAITGTGALRVEVKDLATGASAQVNVAGDGSFSAPLIASAGDTITLKATDGLGRVAGPLVIGSVPFGSANRSLPITIANDVNFRARTIRVERSLAVLASYPAYGTSSDKLVVYDIANPAVPVQSRVVATGIGSIRDFELVNGIAYIAGDRFGTIDLSNPASTVNFGGDQCGVEESLVVSNGYAFTGEQGCAENGRILVYDVTNPLVPRFITNYDVAGFGGHIFHDLLAYGRDYLVGVSSSATGRDVMIIDRRDPGALKKVVELPIPNFVASRGRIAGNTLYLSGIDDGLAMIDLSVITAPRLVSTVNTPGLAYNVEVSGTTVMLADRGAGISFVDASTETLRVTGNELVGGDAWDLAQGGGNLYVANEQGLLIVDNVAAPPDIEAAHVSVSRTAVSGSSRAVGGRTAIQVEVRNLRSGAVTTASAAPDGSFNVPITAASGDRLVLSAADSSNRKASREVAAVPFASIVTSTPAYDGDPAMWARRIASDGTNVVATNGTVYGERRSGSGRMYLFRQSNASEPPALSSFNTGILIDDIELRGGYAYVAGDAFHVVDYLAPAPVRYSTSDQAGSEVAVALAGNYAFTAERGSAENGRIHIWDITSPVAPAYKRFQGMAGVGGIVYRDLVASGNVLFAISPDINRDVTVIDISNVDSLVRLAELNIPNFSAQTATLSGNTLYVTGGDAGVALVDVTNPAAPQLIAIVNTPGYARGVAVSAPNEIVVADGGGPGLTFIDITNKQLPVVIGSQPLDGNATDVKVIGNRIYAATETRFFVLTRP